MNDQIYSALFAVQKKLYEKEGYIEKTEKNKVHGNKYIPLPKLLRAIVPLLHEHGCILIQKNLPSLESGGANVQSVIIHVESGQEISSNCTPPPMLQVGYEETGKDANNKPIKKQIYKITPQSYGGSITYAKRYDLESLFAIPTEDDDANTVSGYSSKPDKAPKPKYASKAELDEVKDIASKEGYNETDLRAFSKGHTQFFHDGKLLLTKKDDMVNALRSRQAKEVYIMS
jgi:hypothetical protein